MAKWGASGNSMLHLTPREKGLPRTVRVEYLWDTGSWIPHGRMEGISYLTLPHGPGSIVLALRTETDHIHWHSLLKIRAISFKDRIDDVDAVEAQHIDVLRDGQTRNAINTCLIFTCTVVSAASFLFGFDDKIISPVAASPASVMKFQGLNSASGAYVLTARNQNLVFSLLRIGSVTGGLFASPLNFHFGRKWPLLLAYLTSVGGGLLQVPKPITVAAEEANR
ncbi:hypothetical protein BDV36DRAFT_291390 [Aspergillus pseudocaelatus]|uniref:Major facilitator superfamily (MFS) profile domain-containing protein n=1 Tax=Aspergillus pseudocaelatus TaxID=1825620 RepID=A0ABQ6WZR8_9EURO|nr:hypothetical protein BDV36DRAFT_291390 [Aspergillus pseudocaelatus]